MRQVKAVLLTGPNGEWIVNGYSSDDGKNPDATDRGTVHDMTIGWECADHEIREYDVVIHVPERRPEPILRGTAKEVSGE